MDDLDSPEGSEFTSPGKEPTPLTARRPLLEEDASTTVQFLQRALPAPVGKPYIHPAGLVDMSLRSMPDAIQRDAGSRTAVEDDVIHGISLLGGGEHGQRQYSIGTSALVSEEDPCLTSIGQTPPCSLTSPQEFAPQEVESLRTDLIQLQQSVSGVYQHVACIGRELRDLSNAFNGYKMEQQVSTGNIRMELVTLVHKEEEKTRSQLIDVLDGEHQQFKHDLMQLAERVNTVSQLLAKERDLRLRLQERVQEVGSKYDQPHLGPDSKLFQHVDQLARSLTTDCQQFVNAVSSQVQEQRTPADSPMLGQSVRVSSPDPLVIRIQSPTEYRMPSPLPTGRKPSSAERRVIPPPSKQNPRMSYRQHVSLSQNASVRSLPGVSCATAEKAPCGQSASVRSFPGIASLLGENSKVAQCASQSTSVRSGPGASSVVSDVCSNDGMIGQSAPAASIVLEEVKPATQNLLLSPPATGRHRPPLPSPQRMPSLSAVPPAGNFMSMSMVAPGATCRSQAPVVVRPPTAKAANRMSF